MSHSIGVLMLKRLIVLGSICCIPHSLFAGKVISVPSDSIKTISIAMAKALKGDTVLVDNGVYSEQVRLVTGVTLVARNPLKAIIDGGQRGTVVTLAKKSTITGFEIRQGTIGIFSKSVGAVISQCRIVHNYQTGITCVRNCALIQDNIIAFNGGSGVQLYKVNGSTGSINHNTIAYNANHGIAAGENTTVLIQNNIIAFNERLGIAIHGDKKDLEITANNIYSNLFGSPPPPSNNFSFDPDFTSPRTSMDFKTKSPAMMNFKAQDGDILGVRILY